jgi:hypothetical protein
MQRDAARCREMQGAIGREMQGDAGRCREMHRGHGGLDFLEPPLAAPPAPVARDMGRYGEIWGDVARYGETWRDIGEIWGDIGEI